MLQPDALRGVHMADGAPIPHTSAGPETITPFSDCHDTNRMPQPLKVNGLLMPPDFPTTLFEHVYSRARLRSTSHVSAFEHFNAAWNAISFRYLALCDDGDAFTASVSAPDGGASLEERYQQERHLFGFFSNGFSAFESFFYGMFAIGALLHPVDFPLATPKEQQAVSPASTDRAYARAFVGDPILATFAAVFTDAAYREWKEVRNILTHRTAPGRTIFVSVESDEDLLARWKINDIALGRETTSVRRGHAARMLSALLNAAAVFTESRIT
jgi:hypothetical protein